LCVREKADVDRRKQRYGEKRIRAGLGEGLFEQEAEYFVEREGERGGGGGGSECRIRLARGDEGDRKQTTGGRHRPVSMVFMEVRQQGGSGRRNDRTKVASWAAKAEIRVLAC
jgi:hypothetical protein